MRALAQHHGDRTPVKAQDFLEQCLGSNKRADCWVAQRQGKLCGFILSYDLFNFVRAKPTRNIDLLFVQPDSRKAGIGRKLMITVAQDAMKQGIARMVVSAAPDNPATHKFYQRLGLQKEYKRSMRFPLDAVLIAVLAKTEV